MQQRTYCQSMVILLIDGLKVWESGAELIGIINGDEAAVILETVRGNLETIYP